MPAPNPGDAAAAGGDTRLGNERQGVTLRRPDERRGNGSTVVDDSLRQAFDASIAHVIGDAGIVGVQLSGGLDSLAVLLGLGRVAPERRIVCYTLDLVDDRGGRTGHTVPELLRGLGVDAELRIVTPPDSAAPTRWSPAGPRLEALPGGTAEVSRIAGADGVDVLLSGDGADELLGTPRFAGALVARSRGSRAAVRYMRDCHRHDPGLWGEALAGLSALLPRGAAQSLYCAVGWPDWCDDQAGGVISPRFREVARGWTREWVRGQCDGQDLRGPAAWARADAHHSLWPHDAIPAAGEVPEQSPFLAEPFFGRAVDIAPHHRYDARLPHRYWRMKSTVLALMPEARRAALPPRKQYFGTALSARAAQRRDAPLCVASGLVDADALRRANVATRLTVDAVETWLEGAVRVGAIVAGV